MKYLLLNKIDLETNANYFGIFRQGALRNNPISVNTTEFEIWLEHAEKSDDNGFLNDFDMAYYFLKRYESIGKFYDIIACIDATENENTPNRYMQLPFKCVNLGYDITDNHLHSLIFWYGYHQSIQIKNEKTFRVLSYSYFMPLLNDFGLFSNYCDAYFFAEFEYFLAISSPELDILHITQKLSIYNLQKILI